MKKFSITKKYHFGAHFCIGKQQIFDVIFVHLFRVVVGNG